MSNMNISTPSALLQPLAKLVGSWELEHRDLNTKEEWGGKDKFEWLPGGHFMAFHHQEDKGVNGVMILGYEKGLEETEPGKWAVSARPEELVGHWFESSSGYHYVYIWEIDEHTVRFWLNDKQSGWSFNGEFSKDGNTIAGTWKWPGGGYDLVMKRVI
jgi:hypothetical protein